MRLPAAGRRWAVALLVPAGMLAVAGSLHARQLIFPEAAALSFGIIGLRIDRWRTSPVRIAVALPAAAALGVGLAHLPGPVAVYQIAALSAVLAGLRVVGSALTPTISAAMLPLVFGLRDWTFVAAVAAIAAVLALAARHQTRPAGPASDIMPTGRVLTGWAIAATWVIVAGPVLHLPAAALAPPLIVATFEWLGHPDRSAALGARQWAITITAAATGMMLAHYMRPAWIGGVTALAATASIMAITATPHPPALAVALLPQIAGAGHPARFVAAVAGGAAVLYLSGTAAHHVAALRGESSPPRNDRPARPGYLPVTVTDTSPVTVYWRPGCPYCAGLRRRLRQLGVHTTEINIWEDPTGAATVRSYAAGNETVPTVVIAGTAMVNPTGPDVLHAARRLAPEAVSDSGPLPPPPRVWPPVATLVAWAVVVAAVTASIVVHAGGHQTLSWVLDALAVAAYLAARVLRRRPPTRSITPR